MIPEGPNESSVTANSIIIYVSSDGLRVQGFLRVIWGLMWYAKVIP